MVGLRGFGVDGASPVLEDPGSSFLRVGARSNPFPWGEWGGLPAGELGSWATKRGEKIFNVLHEYKRDLISDRTMLSLFSFYPDLQSAAFFHCGILSFRMWPSSSFLQFFYNNFTNICIHVFLKPTCTCEKVLWMIVECHSCIKRYSEESAGRFIFKNYVEF